MVFQWVTEQLSSLGKNSLIVSSAEDKSGGVHLLSPPGKYRVLSSKGGTCNLTSTKELPRYRQNKYLNPSTCSPAWRRQNKSQALLTSIASVIPHRQSVSLPARGNLEEVIDSIGRLIGRPQIHPQLIVDGAAACEIVQLVKT